MNGKPQKYKAIRHYHQAGDCHELTFSCYRRWPLLTSDSWRQYLAESIDKALHSHGLNLSAFVFMPEHVHLLVWPQNPARAAISSFLKTLKQSCSTKAKHQLKVACRQKGQAEVATSEHGQAALVPSQHGQTGLARGTLEISPIQHGQVLLARGTQAQRLLDQLTIRERPGKMVFRFWQEGPGYDRNLNTAKSVLSSIDYIHNNPVKRGLVQSAVDWMWSSARHYIPEAGRLPVESPKWTALPAEFLSSVAG
jgi:putative transposase